jgi:integrase/recombinase XerD
VERRRPDLATATAAFLTALAERTRSSQTRRAYASDLRQLVRWAGRRASLGTVHRSAAKLILAELDDARRAPSSVRRRASAYRTFLKFLNSQGWTGPPPALPAPGRSEAGKSSQTTVLTEAELTRLLAAPAVEIEKLTSELARRRAAGSPCRRIEQAIEDRIRDRALLELAFATGLSLGELLELRFADFDLGQRRVRTRGKAPRARTIAFASKSATEAARTYLLQRAKHKRVSPQLFLNRRGKPVHPNAAQAALRRYAGRVRLGPEVTFRSLRRTLAFRLRQRGMDYGNWRSLLGLPLPGRELMPDEGRRVLLVPASVDPREGR